MFSPTSSSVPPDKFMEQLIVQALQAFYVQDYDTGVYFLNQIRSNLPRFLHQLRPYLRNLCKDIVKILQAGSIVPEHRAPTSPSSVTSPDSSSEPADITSAFISELTSAVTSHKEKKKKKIEEELTGSIDDLVDIDV